MNYTQFSILEGLLVKISTSIAQLVTIQTALKALEEEENMITADELGKLADAVTALITAKASDDTAITALQAQVALMTANDAALADPALQAKMDALTAAAAAATIDPNAPPVVIPPVVPVVDPNAPVPATPAPDGSSPDPSV